MRNRSEGGLAETGNGTNLPKVKQHNETLVLDTIRAGGPMSRKRIAEVTGLTFQTVSNIASRLISVGFVTEESRGVRKSQSRTLRLNEDAAYVVGVQLDRSTLSVAITNFAAHILVQNQVDISWSNDPETILSLTQRMVEDLVAESPVTLHEIRGVGIGVPGPIDLERGRLREPPNFVGWERFPLKDRLEQLLGIPAFIDRNASAAALGEHWHELGVNTTDFIYVYLGSGIGSGIFTDGRIHRGASGNSGSIGHFQVEPNGVVCYCGKRGCLEMYATPQGMLREARREVLESVHLTDVRVPQYPESFADVTRTGEPLFQQVVGSAGRRLGTAVSTAADILDPEVIVLGGPTCRLVGSVFEESVVQALHAYSVSSKPVPKVVLSSVGDDAGLIGAATLVLYDIAKSTSVESQTKVEEVAQIEQEAT